MPKANLHYLPDNGIVMGYAGMRGSGIVKVRLDLDWVQRSKAKYNVLFRGM